MKKIIFGILFTIVILSSAVFSFILAKGDSLTMDEKAHIPAGYSYIVKQDFRLNPEHPPLAKMLSGISLAMTKKLWGGNDFFNNSSWKEIDQWDAGKQFIFNSSNNSDNLIFIARIPMVLFLLGLGILLFFWAKQLWGKWIGLAVMSLAMFSPTLLAHGHLVTTDVPIAFFFTLTLYCFWRYLKTVQDNKDSKNKFWFWITSISLGLAFLTKFSAITLWPIMFFVLILKSYLDSKKSEDKFSILFWRYFKNLVFMILISLGIVYIFYFFLSLKSDIGTLHQLINMSFPTDRAEPWRSVLHALEGNIFLKPISQFLLGFSMVFAHVGGGHTAFLLGDVSRKGWWYFFPIAFLLKTTLPVLIIFFISIVCAVLQKPKKYIFSLGIFAITILVYFLISIKSSLNLGIRHLIPIYTFIYLIIGFGIYYIWKTKNIWLRSLIILLIIWHVFESIFSFPNNIAYFNELRFGKEKNQILIDSSLDWGQDLKRLKKYTDENNIQKIKIDYFGGADINYYFGKKATFWSKQFGQTSGWLAVSASRLAMARFTNEDQELPVGGYDWLLKYKPIDVIGDSIYVFYINN